MKKFIGIERRKTDTRVSNEEEEEDTLSLSDLVLINGDVDSEEWENKYCHDHGKSSTSTCSSSSSSNEEVFEFISNYKNNSARLPPENILFCGKLIPYRNPMSSSTSKRPEKRSFSFSRRKLLGYCPTDQMELKDLRNRQNRKVGDGNSDYKYSTCKGKGILWSLIKALSCTSNIDGASYHAQSAVKASIGSISLV